MMKLFAIILATCTLQVNAQSSEEIALIIGGVEKIDGGGVTNEILDVEVYAPFNQDLLDSFLPVPNLKQHISFVKAIYREGEDGQGEVLACGLTNPPNGNMECFKLTLVDGELVWQEGFSGNTINTKYCSLIHQVKTETHPRTYCYESMAKRGKAWFWYSGLESWFSESVIENYISAQYCSVKINIDGTEEPVILHLGGEYYPNEFEAKPQEYPVAVCPNSAVLHPWCNGSDERVRTVEKELAVGYEYDQVIGQATCTTFHDDSGNQVVIIVPSGTLIDAVKIFRVDQCHIYNVIYGDESDTDLCTWQKRKALTPNDKIFIKMGELIEFDSKPTMFGGYVHNESNTAVDYVIQYNLNTNTWTSIKEMSKTRVRHGVVKVPASFLITPVTTEASATSPETTEASATSPVTTEASHASPITTEASATSPVTTEASSTSPVTTEASPTSPVTTEASVTPTTTLRITSSSISSPTSTEPSTTEYDTDTPTDPPTDTPTEYSSTIPTTIVETTTTELYTDFTATPTTKSTTTATTLTTTTTTSNTTGTTSTTITYETTRPTYGPTPVTLYPQPRPLITTTHATTSTTENIKYCRYYNGTTSITFTDCIQVPCPEGTSGISTVCCNPKTGQTGNVDTTDCVSEWTQNAEDMFESGVDSYNITEYIKGSISNQSDYTAGDAIHTLDLVDKLLSERNSSQGNEEDFAENVVSISNSIVSNVSPWKGMTNSTHRYKTTSTLVSNVEKAGFQYLGSRNINDCTCTYEKTMTYSNMEVRYQTSRADELHNNRMRNASIQVPDHIIQQLGTDCIDIVTTNYLIQNAETQQFPNQVSPATMEQKIGSSLVDNILGLSISSSNKSFTISDGMDPFKIFISHPEYANSEKTCAFWQFNTNSWNTKGCYYNFELSSDTETVCDCYHLTNFGIIVDYTGFI